MSDIRDEKLWHAIGQMRRMARTVQLIIAAGDMKPDQATVMESIFIPGLDQCANECEEVLSPDFEKW